MSKSKPTVHEVILVKIHNAAKSAMHLPEFEKELKLLCSVIHESRIPKQAVSSILNKLGEMKQEFKDGSLPSQCIMDLILDIENRK